MKRILIANRGEIARRVIATAHRMGIETVAVYSEPDANAPHVREATLAHALGGTASADSYLRIDKLLAAARACGADAVHPGYGFLSEDAAFAQAVVDAGLTWISNANGPSKTTLDTGVMQGNRLGLRGSERPLCQDAKGGQEQEHTAHHPNHPPHHRATLVPTHHPRVKAPSSAGQGHRVPGATPRVAPRRWPQRPLRRTRRRLRPH